MKGTVWKRPRRAGKAHWEFVFDLGKDPATGQRRRVTKGGFNTKSDAEEALKKAMAEYRDQPEEKPPIPTFAEFFEEWHSSVAARKWSPKTVERTHEQGQYAVRLFGDEPLDQLTDEKLTKHINHLLDHGGAVTPQHPQGRPLAPKTVRHVAFLVQECLQKAVVRKWITQNPMAEVDKPKVPRRRPRIADRALFERLLKRAAETCYYVPIVLANATGIRRGELLALEWSDLDWATGVLEISRSLEQTKQGGVRAKCTKSGETRQFPVPANVIKLLREHREEQDRHRELYGPDYANRNLIFARPDGEYLTPANFGKRVSKLMRAAGLTGITLHSLRHTHASDLLSQGTPITAVAERLGHASANITLGIYSHAVPTDGQVAAKLWNDAMSDVLEASRKEWLARSSRRSANVSADGSQKNVIPIKSAS
jgi:integrase